MFAVYEATQGRYDYLALMAVIVIAGVLVVGCSYVWSRSGSDGALWRGMTSFSEDDLADKTVYPELTRTSRIAPGRRGLSGGKLEVRSAGIRWTAGSRLTPGGQIAGHFLLTWDDIESIDVGDVPGKLQLLGGGITISVQDHGLLRGEFLRPRKALLQSLRAAVRS